MAKKTTAPAGRQLSTPRSDIDKMRQTLKGYSSIDQNGHWRRDEEGEILRRDPTKTENDPRGEIVEFPAGIPQGKAGIIPPAEKLWARKLSVKRDPVHIGDPMHTPKPILVVGGGATNKEWDMPHRKEQRAPGPIFPVGSIYNPGPVDPPKPPVDPDPEE